MLVKLAAFFHSFDGSSQMGDGYGTPDYQRHVERFEELRV
jgi:hypothetical protein